MRPRHKAAENRETVIERFWIIRASMRPRHKAAENLFFDASNNCCIVGFNEAAA